MKRKINKGKKLPQSYLQSAILRYLKKKPSKALNPRTLANKLHVKNSKDSIYDALLALEAKGKISLDSSGKAKIIQGASLFAPKKRLKGKVDIISSGAAYIITDDVLGDVYVPKKHLASALHHDEVLVEVYGNRPGRKPEGKILEVLKRSITHFLGQFQDYKKYGYVFVDDRKHEFEVRILPADFGEAESGQSVIVEITDFGVKKRGQFSGRVTTILSTSDRNDFEMKSILINNGFNLEFPPEVLVESERLLSSISEKELLKRRDMRDVTTFTIDPLEAKDFDDAISLRRLEDQSLEIGVHIADVTHFLVTGSATDKEAFRRSTSVYLVDRVCPMLPERMSNDLCSLVPDQDRLCFSAIFKFNDKDEVIDEWFGRTIIHSDRRFTYEEVQHGLDNDQGEYLDELKTLDRIAKKLRTTRFEKGSIDFESDEIRFKLDTKNEIIDIVKKVRLDAHKLVEDFMLLANRKVARFLGKEKKQVVKESVYRVHDLPDYERLMELAILASEFGIKLNFDTPDQVTESLNNLSIAAESEDLLSVLRPMAIRSMAKAAYATDNIGHFGLGFDYYTHFTSPIRRYSDVLVHRLLQKAIDENSKEKFEELEEKCKHISKKERDAIQAERESVKYKQVEYYFDKIGNEYEGVIRNMIDKGMFVELVESQADGMISFESFEEPFTLHPAKIKAVGNYTDKIYKIGDRLQLRLIKADLDLRQLEFVVVSDEVIETED